MRTPKDSFNFEKMILELDRELFNHIRDDITNGSAYTMDDETLDKGISEMYRVSKKYIMNCEKFEATEKQIDDNHKFRNMYKRWINYKVKIVSDVDMHEDIEPDKARFTLLRKL